MLGCWIILSSLWPSLLMVAADRLEANLLSIARQHSSHSCPILGLIVLVSVLLFNQKIELPTNSVIFMLRLFNRDFMWYIYICMSVCLLETHAKNTYAKMRGRDYMLNHAWGKKDNKEKNFPPYFQVCFHFHFISLLFYHSDHHDVL